MDSAAGFKLIKKIKDDTFDEDRLHQYTLLIQCSARDFQVAAIDSTTKKVVLFEDYVFADLKDHHEHLAVTRNLFDSHELLPAGFWKDIIIGVKNNKFVQVPEPLFVADAAVDYLKFNAQLDITNEMVLFSSSKSSDAVTVFSLQKGLYNWLNSCYKKAPTFIHQSSALIAGTLSYAEGYSPLYVFVDRFKLHVLYLENFKLVYYNQFVIKQFSDYVKYIMLVMKALNLEQETSKVVLWGYIGKNSPHFQEFEKYIRNVSLGGRPKDLTFGYLFDEIQDHHFFDLFSLKLAV